MTNARDRIAERVKNAYAAGYNDARSNRNVYALDYNDAHSSRYMPDRMDEVAETETGKILEVVREALLSEQAVEALAELHIPAEEYKALDNRHLRGIYGMNTDAPMCKVDLRNHYRYAANITLSAAFGADDDGGER